ncbi:MAG: Cof-type HAD-IIB family hydrolase [Sarcina sp.]
MTYKLICVDMDGTLLNDKHEVCDFNKEMIKKATELGVKVAITTGRIFANAKMYSNLIGVKTPIIASNGAYIKDQDSDKEIYKSTLSNNQIDEIVSVVRKYEHSPVYMNTFDTTISEEIIGENHAYKVANSKMEEEWRVKFDEGIEFETLYEKYNREILKAIFINEDLPEDEFWKMKDDMKSFDDIEVVSSGINNFEVMAKGTSKGKAVEKLAQILGIKREEVICIGDSENDLSMIEYAGLGVAMGNGLDILKEKAQYITDTNNNSGVGKVIEKYILNQR